MYKLKTVKVTDLKDLNFYVRKTSTVSIVLSIYLGYTYYSGHKRYYFYDVVGLLGTVDYIYDNQDFEIQPIIDRVFSRKLDKNCLTHYDKSLIGAIYESPYQYKIPDVMKWYTKNRLINNELVELNVKNTLEDKVIKEKELEKGKVYVRSKNKLYYYIGKDSNRKHIWIELQFGEYMGNITQSMWGIERTVKVAKLYSLETGVKNNFISEKMYKYIVQFDIQEYVRPYIEKLKEKEVVI